MFDLEMKVTNGWLRKVMRCSDAAKDAPTTVKTLSTPSTERLNLKSQTHPRQSAVTQETKTHFKAPFHKIVHNCSRLSLVQCGKWTTTYGALMAVGHRRPNVRLCVHRPGVRQHVHTNPHRVCV